VKHIRPTLTKLGQQSGQEAQLCFVPFAAGSMSPVSLSSSLMIIDVRVAK